MRYNFMPDGHNTIALDDVEKVSSKNRLIQPNICTALDLGILFFYIKIFTQTFGLINVK